MLHDAILVHILKTNKYFPLNIFNMKTFYSKQDILNRLKEVYNIQKDIDLANLLGISKSTLSNWVSRDSLDYDRVFSKCEHINIDWLLTGRG